VMGECDAPGASVAKVAMSHGITAVRLNVEQIQLVSGDRRVDLGCIGLQGA
jgi:hypothetical protein